MDGCGLARPRWLDEAEAAWAALPAPSGSPRPAAVPVWRRHWTVLGRDTFAGDLRTRLGVRNVYADHPERYPRVPLAELNGSGAELIVLPAEPYRFDADDGPEAFPALPAALVDGRLLTWYGPSPAEAARVLPSALRRPPRARSASRPPPTPRPGTCTAPPPARSARPGRCAVPDRTPP
ncbi:hypothetical protein QFZ71_000812 [Streptomyces sp. V2I9]|nr:hypothetical protein [Streptomyces sp. V2I9]